MLRKNASRSNSALPISLLAATASALLYAQARRRIRLPATGQASGPSDPSIKKLLQAYDTTLSVVDLALRRPLVLRPYLTFMVVHHIRQMLSAIRGSYYARAALGDSTHEHDRKAVEDFLASLPDISVRRLVVLTASAAVILAAVFIMVLKVMLGTLTTIFEPGELFPQTMDVSIDLVVALADAVLTLDAKAIVDAIEEAGWLNSMATLVVIGLALAYALMSPLASLGRKRALFSLYPDAIAKLRDDKAPLRPSSPRGIYSLENEVFRRLGTKKPPETQLDLWISSLASGFIATLPFGIFAYNGTNTDTWTIAIFIWIFPTWGIYSTWRSWKRWRTVYG
jgi:hypothetical protein